MKTEEFDFESFKKEAIQGLYAGKPLNGEKGIFAPLLKQLLEAALEGELASHLADQDQANRRNGKSSKTIKTAAGAIDLTTPRDRQGSFEPQIVPKRQVVITEQLEEKIISLYGMGMSMRDISAHIQEMYHMELSAQTLSAITDKVIPLVKEWQQRPLESVYTFVWLDCMHYKVRDEGKVVSRAIYNILGVNTSARKDLIGMYISESEGAKFWLSVLTDLKNRGVADMLIACIDNLKGFAEAIASVFPQAQVQSCIVHQIRNSCKYIASKDQKAFTQDLKPVYQAINKQVAEDALLELSAKWEKKYPIVISSWQNNWEKLSTYFQYSQEIRRVIYTTNTIEGFHRQVRKVTKTKGAFPSDMALMKLIYLTVQNISQKWTMPLQNWPLTLSQLSIIFGERLDLDLLKSLPAVESVHRLRSANSQ
jgi:transposase-like protein